MSKDPNFRPCCLIYRELYHVHAKFLSTVMWFRRYCLKEMVDDIGTNRWQAVTIAYLKQMLRLTKNGVCFLFINMVYLWYTVSLVQNHATKRLRFLCTFNIVQKTFKI